MPLLQAALVLWGAIFLLAPLRVWRRQRIPAVYRLEAVPADEVIGANADAGETRRWLLRMGFEELVAARMPGKPSRVAFVLYRQPGDPCGAVLVTAQATRSTFSYLEFTQLFDDGTTLVVNASPMPGAYPPLPGKQVWRYPDMAPAELHSAFLRLRERSRARPVTRLDPARPLATVEAAMARESRALVEAGCVVDPPGPDGHRLRLSAAYVFSWRLLWPVKGLRDRLQRMAARRVLDAA